MKKIIFLFILFVLNTNISTGEIWQDFNTGVTVPLNSASESCIGCFWVCGDSGKVIRSSNAGFNWINVSNGIPSNYRLVKISGAYLGKAIVAGYSGTNTAVWMTRNDGANWIQVFTQSGGHINNVYLIDTTNGIIIGNPVNGRWSIWKTTDGGYNWDSAGMYLPAPAGETGWNNSFYYVDNKIWFGTNNYRIYYSSNFGSSWQVQPTGTEQNIYSIRIFGLFSPNLGFAGGNNLLKTTNMGMNWFAISSPGTGTINGITFASFGGGWDWVWITKTGNNIIYCSSNGGSSWYSAYTSPSGNYTYIYSHSMTGYDYIATNTTGGITYHWVFEGVKSLSGIAPDSYSLSQNYPNPFNPKSNIKFQIAKSGEVKLVIFDVLGREVTTLVNEQLQPGTYEAEWDAVNYPSGVYFYILTTSDYSEKRKMVLVK